jgi:hypothetical protein
MATRAHDGSGLHDSFLRHAGFKWLKIATVLMVLTIAVYALIDVEPRHNGGSWYGYLLGTAGFGIILWLTALGYRKRHITSRPFSVKAWTSAHVYLGLSLIVIGTLHTGFQLGWNVHTLAYVLMMVVILSGIYGVVAYARLPEALSANRGELTQPQMLQNVHALDRQLHDASQGFDRRHSEIVRLSLDNSPIGGSMFQRLQAKRRNCGTDAAVAALDAERRQRGGNLDTDVAAVLTLLERKQAALGQARRHARLKALLEIWLYVHVPATFGLIAALIAHVISVFFYW